MLCSARHDQDNKISQGFLALKGTIIWNTSPVQFCLLISTLNPTIRPLCIADESSIVTAVGPERYILPDSSDAFGQSQKRVQECMQQTNFQYPPVYAGKPPLLTPTHHSGAVQCHHWQCLPALCAGHVARDAGSTDPQHADGKSLVGMLGCWHPKISSLEPPSDSSLKSIGKLLNQPVPQGRVRQSANRGSVHLSESSDRCMIAKLTRISPSVSTCALLSSQAYIH